MEIDNIDRIRQFNKRHARYRRADSFLNEASLACIALYAYATGDELYECMDELDRMSRAASLSDDWCKYL